MTIGIGAAASGRCDVETKQLCDGYANRCKGKRGAKPRKECAFCKKMGLTTASDIQGPGGASYTKGDRDTT
jgi:hypothetical protein